MKRLVPIAPVVSGGVAFASVSPSLFTRTVGLSGLGPLPSAPDSVVTDLVIFRLAAALAVLTALLDGNGPRNIACSAAAPSVPSPLSLGSATVMFSALADTVIAIATVTAAI